MIILYKRKLTSLLAFSLIASIFTVCLISMAHAQPAYVKEIQGPHNIYTGPYDNLAFNSTGYMFVSTSNGGVLVFDPNGNYVMQFGANGQFNMPAGVAVNSNGYIYVADMGNTKIEVFDPNGNYVSQFGSQGSGDGQFIEPDGVAINSSGYIYVADGWNYRIEVFDPNENYVSQFGSQGSGDGQFIGPPPGVTINSSGDVYVSEYGGRVEVFDPAGNYLAQFGTNGSGNGQLLWPDGLAVNSTGYTYVADGGNHRVEVFDPNGNYVTQFGSPGSGDGQFDYPNDVAVNSTGSVFVIDTNNSRVEVFSYPPLISTPMPTLAHVSVMPTVFPSVPGSGAQGTGSASNGNSTNLSLINADIGRVSPILLVLIVSSLLGWVFSLPWLSRLMDFIYEGSKEIGQEKVNAEEIKRRKIHIKDKIPIVLGLSHIELIVSFVCAVLFGIAFFLTEYLTGNLAISLTNIVLFILIAGISLLVHEMAHTYVADRFNKKTEYRFWTLGTIIMFITTLLPPHTVFAQPSRTIIEEGGEKKADKRKTGLMAISGPVASLLLFIAFLAIYLLHSDEAIIKTVSESGMLMNIVLCVYSLMPFKPMDGPEAREWNKLVWAALFFLPTLFYLSLIIWVLT